MTTADDPDGEGTPGGDEALAGEYVLGALDAEARHAAETRIAADPVFAARVARWHNDLAPFNAAYGDEAPPASVRASLERRLFAGAPAEAAGASGPLRSLALWRGLSAAFALAAIVLAVLHLVPERPTGTAPRLVAELAAEDSPINLVAVYDAAAGRLTLTPAAAGAGEPRSLELWLIEGDAPPVSLGIVPPSGEGVIAVPPDRRDGLAEGATLAVSLEPAGGSPTGRPTGPVVAAGTVRGG